MRLLAIDLDDTLLSKSLEITKENYDALEAAHNEGVKIVICTGRPYPSTRKIVKRLSFLDASDCYVSFNGALISSMDDKELFKAYLNKDQIGELVDYSREYNETLQLYTKEELVVEVYDDVVKSYEQLTGMKAKVVEDLKSLDYSAKALFNAASDDISQLDLIKASVDQRFSDEIIAFYSKHRFLEMLNSTANKGLAVKQVAEMYDIKPSEVIAVGDSYNDLFMLEYAGIGVAVANAREAVKEAANYVTKATHDESAIAEVIEKYILSK